MVRGKLVRGLNNEGDTRNLSGCAVSYTSTSDWEMPVRSREQSIRTIFFFWRYAIQLYRKLKFQLQSNIFSTLNAVTIKSAETVL